MATRYQRDNQNPLIKVEQTTQWPQDTKGIIRIVNQSRTDNTMATGYQRDNQNP